MSHPHGTANSQVGISKICIKYGRFLNCWIFWNWLSDISAVDPTYRWSLVDWSNLWISPSVLTAQLRSVTPHTELVGGSLVARLFTQETRVPSFDGKFFQPFQPFQPITISTVKSYHQWIRQVHWSAENTRWPHRRNQFRMGHQGHPALWWTSSWWSRGITPAEPGHGLSPRGDSFSKTAARARNQGYLVLSYND